MQLALSLSWTSLGLNQGPPDMSLFVGYFMELHIM